MPAGYTSIRHAAFRGLISLSSSIRTTRLRARPPAHPYLLRQLPGQAELLLSYTHHGTELLCLHPFGGFLPTARAPIFCQTPPGSPCSTAGLSCCCYILHPSTRLCHMKKALRAHRSMFCNTKLVLYKHLLHKHSDLDTKLCL